MFALFAVYKIIVMHFCALIKPHTYTHTHTHKHPPPHYCPLSHTRHHAFLFVCVFHFNFHSCSSWLEQRHPDISSIAAMAFSLQILRCVIRIPVFLCPQDHERFDLSPHSLSKSSNEASMNWS